MSFWPSNIIILFFLSLSSFLSAQGFTNWIVGDTSDFQSPNFEGGLVLAGGGGDNDQAMQWMLSRADGGDVVVIRASNSDGYNDYFFEELGVAVNSVETIRFDGVEANVNDYVIRQIRNAEVLFIAGGDQYDYYQYWKDSPIEEAINFLINEKGITVGGTSAGMAILGGAYYTPSGGSLQSDQALANPYHPNINILGNGDFIEHPLMNNVITDTHYDQRDRKGRQITFMARLVDNAQTQFYGIACNEYTAVCIDTAGLAHVFGQYPEYNDFAYFLISNCQEEFNPETILGGLPLTWNRQEAAVKVYRLPGREEENSALFNLQDWQSGVGGLWEKWYVDEGVLFQNEAEDGNCNIIDTEVVEFEQREFLRIYPNPTESSFQLDISNEPKEAISLTLFNTMGQKLWNQAFNNKQTSFGTNLNAGIYWLQVEYKGFFKWLKIVKQ